MMLWLGQEELYARLLNAIPEVPGSKPRRASAPQAKVCPKLGHRRKTECGFLRGLLNCACASPPFLQPIASSSVQSTWYVKQPTWRLWGEEKGDGVVYTVYLKKVRYHRPSKSVSSDSDDEISHLEWETVRVRFVKAASLEKLVESLATDDGELESTYITVFLATYRTFATPKEVLTLLVDRYRQLDANLDLPEVMAQQHKKTLVTALHVWLDTYSEDFRQPPDHPLLGQLLDFVLEYVPGAELELKVRHRLDRFRKEDQYIDPGLIYSNNNFCLIGNGAVVDSHHYKFPSVSAQHFAEQLTRMDLEVFKKLVPHQCLGRVWSRKDKSRALDAPTTLATVNQFNAVSFRVISTILVDADIRPTERATVIATWIDIAQELRVLKNFSSLKAITSGLQINSVHRLRKTWDALPQDKRDLFAELARICSEDNNQWAQRELLNREGTAKYANTVGSNDRQLQKVLQKQLTHSGTISIGTIPYMGTFLKDLTMIDQANPDKIYGDLINFDKRRKEFEMLAHIKMLQGAANSYNIAHDVMFDKWFDSILLLDDREANELSVQIEPGTDTAIKHRGNRGGHRKNDSIASTGSSSNSSSQFYCDPDSNSVPSSPHNSLDRKLSSSSSSSSSLPSLDVSISSGNTGHSYNANIKQPPNSPAYPNPNFYVIKVRVETTVIPADGVVMYKSIMLCNNERTPQVIRNAMLKLGIEGNPDSYEIAQVLPEKELLMPSNANVFYAVDTACDLNFVLRLKKSPIESNSPNKSRTRHK